jgi:hypothetical protein
MVNLPGRLVDFSNQNDEMTSLVDSEYQKNDHKKVLNEDAFNRPEILNNRVLFERIRNWRTFSLVFLAFSVLQVVIEGLFDYDLFHNYEANVARAQSFYQGVDFVNARWLFNCLVFRGLTRGPDLAGLLLRLRPLQRQV